MERQENGTCDHSCKQAMKRKQAKKSPAGFTLIEYVVVILVMSFIISIFAAMLVQGTKAFNFAVVRETLMTEAEAALERMTREIRSIMSPGHIIAVQPDEFSFADGHGDVIRYFGAGGKLFRNDNRFSENLQSLSFNYLDSGNNPVEEEDYMNIRIIEVKLVLSRGGKEVEIESRIRPRNF